MNHAKKYEFQDINTPSNLDFYSSSSKTKYKGARLITYLLNMNGIILISCSRDMLKGKEVGYR